VSDCCLTPTQHNFSAISWREQVTFDEMMMMSTLHYIYIDQHAELDFYSANSLKQQSTDRHVAPL